MSSDDVRGLESLPHEELLPIWNKTFGTAPPKRMSAPLMRRVLAFEIQTKDRGGLSRQVREKLDRLAEGNRRPRSSTIKPGGRLIREWNGVSHLVEVTESGFNWKGQSYRSLSAVARAITGARWSGPRFFGLIEDSRS